ncbi:MAG: hypothetical protein RL154_1629, partial [Pseudomonadota bacterium]
SLVHPDDRDFVDASWRDALNGTVYDIEHRIVVDGNIKWVRESAKLVFDDKGKLAGGIGIAQDVSERKAYQAKLEHLALYDQLTGLLNRNGFLCELNKLIKDCTDSNFALIIFDLDRFKDVNDSFGHTMGDDLIKLASLRLKDAIVKDAIISRIGGDEFGIIIKNVLDKTALLSLIDDIIIKLSENYQLSNLALVHVGASSGVAFYPAHGKNAEDLIKNADAALFIAKNEGRGTVRAYNDTLTQNAIFRLTIETALRQAIKKSEFIVYYQPQIHIASGDLIGVEALVRWNRDGVIVPPIEFIGIAEETGLIVAIGEFVLNEACKQAKIWNDAGHRLRVAVNVSTVQLRFPNFVSTVDKALKNSGLLANRLELEITESALAQREEDAIAILHSLRALGIKLALDDFGTGYSSLTYLKRLPIDVIKIDKSFVDELPFSAEDVAISKAIIALGKALNLMVLAEGVERENQYKFLKEQDCDIYQGYYMSRPLDAIAFEKAFLKIHR